MSDQPTKKYLYIQKRLEGYGRNEAARQAGYESGRPPKGARRLWDLVEEEQGCDTSKRTVQLRKKVDRLEFELRRANLRLRAVQALRRQRYGES